MKKPNEYEINGVTSIDEVTARDSTPFLDAMAIFYGSRASRNAFFELLHLYMNSTGKLRKCGYGLLSGIFSFGKQK